MLKRAVISALVVAGTTAGVTATTVAPASADQRPCVSRAEYSHVVTRNHYNAWTMAKVQDHFDTPGSFAYQSGSGGHADVVRQYRKCAGWAKDTGTRYVGVWFDNYSFWDSRFHAWAKNPNTAYRFF